MYEFSFFLQKVPQYSQVKMEKKSSLGAKDTNQSSILHARQIVFWYFDVPKSAQYSHITQNFGFTSKQLTEMSDMNLFWGEKLTKLKMLD